MTPSELKTLRHLAKVGVKYAISILSEVVDQSLLQAEERLRKRREEGMDPRLGNGPAE